MRRIWPLPLTSPSTYHGQNSGLVSLAGADEHARLLLVLLAEVPEADRVVLRGRGNDVWGNWRRCQVADGLLRVLVSLERWIRPRGSSLGRKCQWVAYRAMAYERL